MKFNDIEVERIGDYLTFTDVTTGGTVDITAEEWVEIVAQYEDYTEPLTTYKWKEGALFK